MRLHQLTLSLLHHFLSPSTWRALAEEVGKGEEKEGVVWEDAYVLAQQICANLIGYCYTTMTIGTYCGCSHMTCLVIITGAVESYPLFRVLFTPDLAEAVPMATGFRESKKRPSHHHYAI